MGLQEFLLVAAALLPAIVLCIYTFKKDRVEKEPIGLLLRLFLFGALSVFPAALIESGVIDGIDAMFRQSFITMPDGSVEMNTGTFYVYNFIKYFIGVALVEEGVKFCVLVWVTKKTKEFNSLFDGLIYAIFVSLGFAALENVFYVLDYGWINAIQRAILSVPGHMFFSVLMGYYYSEWHITQKAKAMEQQLKQDGYIKKSAPEFSVARSRVLCFLMPILAHGFYDYCCTLGDTWSMSMFYIFIAFLYWYCFKKIRLMSRADTRDTSFAKVMVMRKYPSLFQ